jgi:IclR family pca regulon transcriptional regulator
MNDLPPSLSPSRTPAPAEPSRPGDAYLQSFARGLAVIRSFGAGAPRQTITDVARSTGLTRAAARRILMTLGQLGYVHAHERQFSLTPKILDLGFAYLSSLPVWHLAEPVLQALAAELEAPCSAMVLDGADVVCVLHASPSGGAAGVGSRGPAHTTAAGRVLLAGLCAGPCADDHGAVPAPPALSGDAAPALAEVRRQGWCLVDHEDGEDRVSVAAPVVDRAGNPVAALTVSCERARMPPALMQERLLPRLRDAARLVSQRLRMHA